MVRRNILHSATSQLLINLQYTWWEKNKTYYENKWIFLSLTAHRSLSLSWRDRAWPYRNVGRLARGALPLQMFHYNLVHEREIPRPRTRLMCNASACISTSTCTKPSIGSTTCRSKAIGEEGLPTSFTQKPIMKTCNRQKPAFWAKYEAKI